MEYLVQWSDGSNLYSSCEELSVVTERGSRVCSCPFYGACWQGGLCNQSVQGYIMIWFPCGESKIALNVDCCILRGCRGYRYMPVAR